MEWILQVVDEFDDVLGALRHRWLGFHAEIAALLFAGIGVGAMLAAFALGADPLMVGTAAIVLNLAALLQIRESRAAPRT
jgi:hypothetical protein